MSMRKFLMVLCIIMAPLVPAFALNSSKRITQYVNDVWQNLPPLAGWVNTIHQSRDGYLWVGTDEGLARFDGVRFTLDEAGNHGSAQTILGSSGVKIGT